MLPESEDESEFALVYRTTTQIKKDFDLYEENTAIALSKSLTSSSIFQRQTSRKDSINKIMPYAEEWIAEISERLYSIIFPSDNS